MLFNSLAFLIFFPTVTILYWVLPYKWRNPILLIASYYFYMNWEPVYALLIAFSTITTWFGALRMSISEGSSRKLWLWSCIIVNLGILFIFKYFNFFTTEIFGLLDDLGIRMKVPRFSLLLPVGISFYTFQAIGYLIDVWRRTVKAENSLLTYALFVAFFPQLVAGPVERSSNLLPQFKTVHKFNEISFIEGLKMMVFGYFMKLCIADNVSTYVDAVYNNLPFHNGNSILLASFSSPSKFFATSEVTR